MDFFRLILALNLTLVGADFSTMKRKLFNQNHTVRRSGQMAKRQAENLANLAERVEFDQRFLEKLRIIGRKSDYWTYYAGFYKSTHNGEANPILKWTFIF